MAIHVDLDVVENCQVRITRNLLEIRRRAVVSGIPVDCTSGTDASILLKAIGSAAVAAGLPAQYSLFPDSSYPAVLEDYYITSVRAVDTVQLEMTYRLDLSIPSGGGANWVMEEDTQTYQTETYATADGSKALTVYYKSGVTIPGDLSVPSTAHQRIGKARKLQRYKVLRVTGKMTLAVWKTIKATVVPAELHINSDTWGSGATWNPRGSWLYLGHKEIIPIPERTGTPDTAIFCSIELRFLKDPLLHYALLLYLNERREHPKDATSESTLRGLGLPTVNNLITHNGKTLASIYGETTFSDKFTFHPLVA